MIGDVGAGGTLQALGEVIERVPGFGIAVVVLTPSMLSGWLGLGLLVAGGVVCQVRDADYAYTLIVASTVHECSSGHCLGYPGPLRCDKHRNAAAASRGRFRFSVGCSA